MDRERDLAVVAEELAGDDLDRGIKVFSLVSESQGGRAWTLEEVMAPAPYRLYRATATEHWVLDPERRPDRRIGVGL